MTIVTMNEYELLYLFQEGHNKAALFSLYKLYVPFLENVKRRAFYKYFGLPIELADLESLKYFSVLESAKKMIIFLIKWLVLMNKNKLLKYFINDCSP
ncbi:hypothetical protein M1771_01275 [Spiroplasma citri]|uniref:Uncharacterized protein n=2 Tax=Spiroplasma citri TaxID=2133 RepID=A0AAX3SZZ6_SPICI|nr:hypothetical protein [Spiroplasma citri]WFG96679.1 hypothetical protein M0C40_01285 [Spiroplasma citri]WFH00572.1 hypothetical protein M1771_01275 [Spiroplasma citri]